MGIKQQVITIFQDAIEHEIDPDVLALDVPLKNIPYVDSLVILKFVSGIETTFNVSVSMVEVDSVFRSLGSVITYLEDRSRV